MSDVESLSSSFQSAFESVDDPAFLESPLDSDPLPAGETPPGIRRGLPSGHRMRHDAHYVEYIASRPAASAIHLVPIADIECAHAVDPGGLSGLVASIRRHGILQPLLIRRRNGRHELIAGARRLAAAGAAGLAEVPCLIHDADDTRARALAEADNLHAVRLEEPRPSGGGVPLSATRSLTESLATVLSCLNLVPAAGRQVRERVALDLIALEAERAALLVRSLQVLSDDPLLVRKLLDPTELLHDVLAAWAPEHRLTGTRVSLSVGDGLLRFTGDAHLVSLAFAGVMVAMTALLETSDRSALRISVCASSSPAAVRVEFAQDEVTVPPTKLARLFDLTWADRPGGYAAGIGLVAARRVAELHGGRLESASGDRGGCRLTVVLPAEV